MLCRCGLPAAEKGTLLENLFNVLCRALISAIDAKWTIALIGHEGPCVLVNMKISTATFLTKFKLGFLLHYSVTPWAYIF